MTRFPTYPPDILSRADALLSEKYGTDKPIDPLLVEIACEAMMVQREVDAKVAETYYDNVPDALRDAEDVALVAAQNGIAKAIRGTK